MGAFLLIAAVAIGPIWQMTRPVERGPLVFTLSAFALEPALGLHSPMFETPRPTRSGEWSPVAEIAPRAPYDVGRPFVPAKVSRPADFAVDPAIGPMLASITLGDPIGAPMDGPPPFVARLPVQVVEPVLDPEGVAEGLGSALDAVPGPVGRPAEIQNG